MIFVHAGGIFALSGQRASDQIQFPFIKYFARTVHIDWLIDQKMKLIGEFFCLFSGRQKELKFFNLPVRHFARCCMLNFSSLRMCLTSFAYQQVLDLTTQTATSVLHIPVVVLIVFCFRQMNLKKLKPLYCIALKCRYFAFHVPVVSQSEIHHIHIMSQTCGQNRNELGENQNNATVSKLLFPS